MTIIQLSPPIPMTIVDKGNGYAIAMIDYSQEHDLMFVIAMDDTGEVWTTSNKNVRMQKNITLGRVYDKGYSKL
jgi:hypothetical protein